MSSRRYCDLNEPHESHEWYSPSSIDDRPGASGDYFYCEGVLDAWQVRECIQLRDRAARELAAAEERLATIALRHRRKEPE